MALPWITGLGIQAGEGGAQRTTGLTFLHLPFPLPYPLMYKVLQGL